MPAAFAPEEIFWRNEQQWTKAKKPLCEIQIEICQEALRQWRGVSGTIAGEEGASHTYTAAEKAHFVEAVTKEIVELKRTRRAVFLDTILPSVAAPSGWTGFDEQSEL